MSASHSESLLTASVGFAAVNRAEDLEIVQILFGMIGDGQARHGQASVNDVAMTIRAFQARIHFPAPDGRIDVGGRTLRALIAQAAQAQRVGRVPQTSSTALKAKIERALDGVVAREAVDKTATTKTTTKAAAGGAAKLTDADFTVAAERLKPGVQVAMIRAFAEVESGGKSGFGPAGLPVIAYEGHIFRKYTNHIYDKTHALLSYVYVQKAGPEWKQNNKDQETAWKTLESAMELDKDSALQACSWGMFQVMGFNYHTCGFTDVDGFVASMKAGERGQLDAFVGFCLKTSGLRKALADKNFVQCATHYNGSDYGDYDKRIEKAFKKHGGV